MKNRHIAPHNPQNWATKDVSDDVHPTTKNCDNASKYRSGRKQDDHYAKYAKPEARIPVDAL
jgi:hypothetical protein